MGEHDAAGLRVYLESPDTVMVTCHEVDNIAGKAPYESFDPSQCETSVGYALDRRVRVLIGHAGVAVTESVAEVRPGAPSWAPRE